MALFDITVVTGTLPPPRIACPKRQTTGLAENFILSTWPTLSMPPGFKRLATDSAVRITHLTRQRSGSRCRGAGLFGTEFACFSRDRTQVTRSRCAAAGSGRGRRDRDALERELKKQKIDLHLGTKVDSLNDGGNGAVSLTLAGGKTLEVDTVLVATGRRPYTTDLGLEQIGVARGDRGKIAVNDKLQTSLKGVYAIGDVTDIKQLAHFASAQGKAAAELIAGHSAQTNWRAVPAATFTNPEIASVGLTERRGEGQGRTVKIGASRSAPTAAISPTARPTVREDRGRCGDRSGAGCPHHRRQGQRVDP